MPVRSRPARAVLVTLAAATTLVCAAPGTWGESPEAMVGAVAVAQPPLPVPPVDDPSCPGSVVPGCLPPVSAPPSPPPSPLPPITEVPAPDPSQCFPGSVLPGCPPPGGPPPPPACEGPNCIPQPVPPGPLPGTPPAPGSGGADESECGILDPIACVTDGIEAFFRGLVEQALNPLLELLGTTLLTTPEPQSLPAVGQLWTESWQLMVVGYAILILIAGIVLMGYQTLQTRYSVKELAPRIVVGFLAGTLSQFVAVTGIRLANALAAAVMGDGLDPATAGKAMTEMFTGSIAGGEGWLFLIAVALVVMIVVLLVTYVVRIFLTIALIAAAPLALMWHALPHTEGIATVWWKGFGGLLLIQVGQSLTLVVVLRVFFTPGGISLFGPTPSGLVYLLLCLALLWILIKIPFWCLSPLRSGGRRSLLGSVVRGILAYKTMGLLGSAGALAGGKRSPRGGHRPAGPGGPPADPPATRDGQFMMPMRLRRTRPGPRRSPRLGEQPGTETGAHHRPGAGQLSLFTASGSGDDRTVSANPRALPLDPLPGALPRDQLGLPITTRRDPDRVGRRSLADDLAARGSGMPPPVPQSGLFTGDGRINRNARPPAHLPRALIAPGAGMLPIHLRPAPPRTPRRTLADDLAAAPASPRQTGPGLLTPSGQISRAARAARRRARDAYTGNRALASGQYPLPLGVRRQPKPPPPPASGASASPPPKRRAGTQLALPLDLPARRAPKRK